MSARETIADHLLGHRSASGQKVADAYDEADAILSALSEAGYTVARLEVAGWASPDDPVVLLRTPVAEWPDDVPLYRVVASPVAPPVSREAQ